jgi:hypothetical protein
MTQNSKTTEDVDLQIVVVRDSLPKWVDQTIEMVEHAANAERAAVHVLPDTAERSRQLIVEVAEWQQKLSEWQALPISPRLMAELRILKATLDASMDEANAAAKALGLQD